MDILQEDHKQLLILLINNNVDFMLIGGYAVIHYGYERSTSDMDIWIKPSLENKVKLLDSLRQFGIEDDDLKQMNSIDFTQVNVFTFGDKPNKIDLLTHVQGLAYETADKQKVFFPLKDKQVPIVQYHHLIQIKMIAGRAQDKADIEVLQQINQFRDKKW